MNQLESDANLARLRNPTVRHLVVLLMETGLRGGDACVLAFNPIIDDSTGWPCLRFDNSKVETEQLIPLSAKAADTIRAQQAHVRMALARTARRGCSPASIGNPDGTKPYAHGQPVRPARQLADARSTCATKPASPCASTPTSSATPSAPD